MNCCRGPVESMAIRVLQLSNGMRIRRASLCPTALAIFGDNSPRMESGTTMATTPTMISARPAFLTMAFFSVAPSVAPARIMFAVAAELGPESPDNDRQVFRKLFCQAFNVLSADAAALPVNNGN